MKKTTCPVYPFSYWKEERRVANEEQGTQMNKQKIDDDENVLG